MRIYLRDQEQSLNNHLERLRHTPVMQYDVQRLHVASSTIALSLEASAVKLDSSFIMAYDIFPPSIMTSLTEWSVVGREMQVGDTIVQQVYIPPTRMFSQKLIFGVRVSEIIHEPQRIGFSYETLEGHVERGVSTFVIEQRHQGLHFKIDTLSTPGTFVAKMLGPLFSVPYQTYCTRRALEYVKRRAQSQFLATRCNQFE